MASRVTLAKVPVSFSGDKKKFETFESQARRYMGAYAAEFNDDAKKIWFILSLLGSEDGSPCAAGTWARNWEKNHLDASYSIKKVPAPTAADANATRDYTIVDFWATLRIAFYDHTRAQTALTRLRRLKQGTKTLAEFITDFELLANEAELNPGVHGSILRDYLKENVNSELTGPLYNGAVPVPPDYQGYVNALAQVALNVEEWKARGENRNPFWKPAAAQKTASEATQKTWNQTGSKTVASGSGSATAPNLNRSAPAPMDVDRSRTFGETRKCYNCDKPGHLSRDCKEPRRPRRFNARAVIAQIDELPADDAELKELVEKLRAKGF